MLSFQNLPKRDAAAELGKEAAAELGEETELDAPEEPGRSGRT